MIARGFQRDRSDTAALRFTGQLTSRGRTVSVAVVYEDRDLTRTPKLYLLNRAAELPDAVAHIEDGDRLCYVREEHLLLDPLNPRGSVALCLIKMVDALDRLITLDLSSEISREFPQHWSGLPVYLDLPMGFSGTAGMYALRTGTDAPMMVIAPSKESLLRIGVADKDRREIDRKKTSVHVISVKRELTFARGQRAPCTLQELLNWLQSIEPEAITRLMAAIPSTWPALLYFLLHASNGSVGGSLVLPLLLERSIQRPKVLGRMLASWAPKILINKIYGVRLDADFVARRNMNDQPNLSGKRVALIGLGTIGGFVAKFLAQSGAGVGGGQLFLIDEQMLAPGNIGRHFLGLLHVGKNKAKATQEELRRIAPDSNVGIFAGNVLERISDLFGFDLVVDATGERALSEVLNKEFVNARRLDETKATVLHVWLVGNGVAAQALLVDGGAQACFRCLRLERSDQERFRLLRPDHPARLTPANCGEGAYFAYGVGAPAIAGGLAIQLCLDWVKGRPSPRFRTIRVVNEATFDVKDSDVLRRDKCPVCVAA